VRGDKVGKGFLNTYKKLLHFLIGGGRMILGRGFKTSKNYCSVFGRRERIRLGKGFKTSRNYIFF
jgi:hypothetical protein